MALRERERVREREREREGGGGGGEREMLHAVSERHRQRREITAGREDRDADK